jgi:8-oxo-dGTP pyrophosphatase MutT (NUDIX family)
MRVAEQFTRRIRNPYSGAGILFVSVDKGKLGDGIQVLLGCRKHSGIWSIPGGGRKTNEDFWETALRETTEEFGEIPAGAIRLCSVAFPFSKIGYDWRTFVVRLDESMGGVNFPDSSARDFRHEFQKADWFPIFRLPERTHPLVYPAIWRYKIHHFYRQLISKL